jgi:hypothetical protein
VAKCNGCFYVLHKDARVSVIDVTVPALRVEATGPVTAGLMDNQFTPIIAYFQDGRLVGCDDGEVLFVWRLVAYREKEETNKQKHIFRSANTTASSSGSMCTV